MSVSVDFSAHKDLWKSCFLFLPLYVDVPCCGHELVWTWTLLIANMFSSAQDFLLYWVRQRAVVATLRSALINNNNYTNSNILRGREVLIIIVMTGTCIVQVLRWMQVWVLLASDFLAHATTTATATAVQLQVRFDDNHALICPVPTFYNLAFPICTIYDESHYRSAESVSSPSTEPPAASTSPTTAAAQASPSVAAQNVDVNDDSPLDNANFLSFEDWKKQNLAKIGQSADNVGGKRQGSDIGQERRAQARPINNALDSLGDDAEIELNFDGFGSESSQPTPWESGSSNENANAEGESSADSDSADNVSAVGRRKDAGTTCKERFNYASFDCAATVLKTNPECSGSSSVLIENKDSYMLNECRAKDKFLILELCDDILVDTIVLANYEFFSSIFHTFRVSVSDRYPVKADKWKELGIFEAKNTRAIQAFAVENPLIWARYLKIEFLTHYGSEFYCPLSLVRVHGTTMLEEYKNEGDSSRSDEEIMETAEEVGRPVEAEQESHVQEHEVFDNSTARAISPVSEPLKNTSPLNVGVLEMAALEFSILETCAADYSAIEAHDTPNQTNVKTSVSASGSANTTVVTPSDSKASAAREQTSGTETNIVSRSEGQDTPARGPGADSSTMRTPSASGEDSTSTVEPTKVTPSTPPSPNPTTQESFFKSVNKRLQMLESNSTLSLLYIEEQSRMLRDAFSKVEKRQMAKMNTFLEELNTTVIDEIRNLHLVYQSLRTIVLDDFEHQQREVSTAASQLAILTNELVFQKRMTALSSVLIMILFALILFPRGSGIVGGIDFHSMIPWSPRPGSSAKVSRIPSTGPSSPGLDSETATPLSINPPKKTHRRQCSNALSHKSIRDLRECTNQLAHSSEDLQFTGYDGNGRFRSLSELSDSDINKIPYTPFSSDLQHMLGYDSAHIGPQINVAKETSASPPSISPLPDLAQDRPVSSPPVLNGTGLIPDSNHMNNDLQGNEIDSGSDSDDSIEPFPPFPTD